MKPIISAVAFAGLFTMAACNNSAIKEKEAALQAKQQTIDSMNMELAKKKVVDSMNEVMGVQYAIPSTTTLTTPEVKPAPAVATTRKATTRRSSAGRSRTSGSSNNNNNSVAQAPAPVYQAAPEPVRKKGWSAKAKGAVIGAGTGAAAGAIINKRNRAAGAVIGGVLGAATGTGVGAVIDKKQGR